MDARWALLPREPWLGQGRLAVWGVPPPPHRSSASPPSTVGREQVEIQDGKIQSKTGKAWGPSSEQGPDPGLVRAWLPGLPWLPEPRPRAPAQRSTPQHRLSQRCPEGKQPAALVPLRRRALPSKGRCPLRATRRNKSRFTGRAQSARPAAATQTFTSASSRRRLR